LVKVQPTPMEEALFKLGPQGRRHLERCGWTAITPERQPPKQLEHFLGVNDVRIAAELIPGLLYFFAYWELPAIGWKHPIIPDALFGIWDRSFAVEFDRGQENVRFFVRTKLGWYGRGLEGVPLNRILIITDRQPRLEALARAI